MESHILKHHDDPKIAGNQTADLNKNWDSFNLNMMLSPILSTVPDI